MQHLSKNRFPLKGQYSIKNVDCKIKYNYRLSINNFFYYKK